MEKGSSLWPPHVKNVSTVSWFVAHRFNRGHRDRIWDDKLHKLQLLQEAEERIRTLTDEEGNFPSEEAREEALKIRDFYLTVFRLIDGAHRQTQRLTEKHRASFSRTLKRLERRGLVECLVDLRVEQHGERWFWVPYVGDGRTRYVRLTAEGVKACRALFR